MEDLVQHESYSKDVTGDFHIPGLEMSSELSYVDVPMPQEATPFRHPPYVSKELEGSGESTSLGPSGFSGQNQHFACRLHIIILKLLSRTLSFESSHNFENYE